MPEAAFLRSFTISKCRSCSIRRATTRSVFAALSDCGWLAMQGASPARYASRHVRVGVSMAGGARDGVISSGVTGPPIRGVCTGPGAHWPWFGALTWAPRRRSMAGCLRGNGRTVRDRDAPVH